MSKKLMMAFLISGLLFMAAFSSHAEEGFETSWNNSDLVGLLTELLALDYGSAPGEADSDEARFQHHLALLPQGLQGVLTNLDPSTPVVRGTVEGILALYMNNQQIDQLLGEGSSEDPISLSEVLVALEQSGFYDQFQEEETLGFIAPQAHDFDSLDRESKQLQENYRIPLSGE